MLTQVNQSDYHSVLEDNQTFLLSILNLCYIILFDFSVSEFRDVKMSWIIITNTNYQSQSLLEGTSLEESLSLIPSHM